MFWFHIAFILYWVTIKVIIKVHVKCGTLIGCTTGLYDITAYTQCQKILWIISNINKVKYILALVLVQLHPLNFIYKHMHGTHIQSHWYYYKCISNIITLGLPYTQPASGTCQTSYHHITCGQLHRCFMNMPCYAQSNAMLEPSRAYVKRKRFPVKQNPT